MAQNPRWTRITNLTIALAAILPMITTVILLRQHTSESGNEVVLGRWTYAFFIIALLPMIVTLPALAVLWLRRSRNTINLAVSILSLFVLLVPLELATYTKAMNVLNPRFISFIPSSCVRKEIVKPRGFLGEVDLIHFPGVPGVQKKPNLKYSALTPPERGQYRMYDIELDRNGFNNERSVADLSSIDLIFVGDSFTDGTLPREENFVTVASQLLNQPALNLGIGGTGPQQHRWAVEQRGLSYKPKVVVWQLFEKDIYDAVVMDEWLSDDRGLNYTDFFTMSLHTERELSAREEDCHRIKLNFPFLVLGLVQQSRTQISEAGELPPMRIQAAGDRPGTSPPYFEFPAKAFGLASLCNYPLSLNDWQDTARVTVPGTAIELNVGMRATLELIETEIRELAETSRSEGFDLFIMPTPIKELVYENQIIGHLRKAGRDLTCPDGRPPRVGQEEYYWLEWLRATAAKYDLKYLDLLSYLRREAADGSNDLFYFTDDLHFNVAGNAATGEFLYQELKGTVR